MFSVLPVLHSNDTQRSIGCFNEGKLWNTCFIPVEIVVLPSLQLPLLGGAVGARGEEQSRKISRLRFCGYSALRVSPPPRLQLNSQHRIGWVCASTRRPA
eukprot:scaffold2534_cov176-Alexandrium_tamarense.AAC.5